MEKRFVCHWLLCVRRSVFRLDKNDFQQRSRGKIARQHHTNKQDGRSVVLVSYLSIIILLFELRRLLLFYHLLGVFRRDNRVAQLAFQLRTCRFCHTAAALGYMFALV